jgi:transposase
MKLLYTGIDFHKRTSTICFLKNDGTKEIKTINSDNLVTELVNRKNLLVAIEATCGVNHVVDQLKSHQIDVKIINPNKFRGIGIGGKKTDIKDAEALAECLKVNFIPTVHHKSIGSRRLKSLLRIREQYVQNRVRITNGIRGTLREYGLKMPAGTESFWEQVYEKIGLIDYIPLKDQLRDLANEAKRLKRKEQEVEKTIKTLLEGDVVANNIMSIPGVGLLTAAAFIAVADDLSRFKNAKAFASYIGLVPREFSSGDKQRMGSITKAGQEILRRYFIHGARTVLRYSNDTSKEPIRVWGNKLKQKIGANKATVALAHKLARICFRVAIEERLYVKKYNNKK